jgi:hypothetical protein
MQTAYASTWPPSRRRPQRLFNPATTGDLPVLAATFAVGQELSNGVNSGPTGSFIWFSAEE